MAAQEHEVEISLVGNPRWWTVTNHKGSREVVRVVFEKGKHYALDGADPDAPPEMVIFVLLPPGLYAFPPMVAAMLRLGDKAWKDIEEKGGQVVPYPTKLGKKLELMLVAAR